MADESAKVTLSISGLPPAYTERLRQIEIPAQEIKVFDDLLSRSNFFALPEHLDGNASEGRDMGTYSITVNLDGRIHAVSFSDSSITQGLADLMAWLKRLPEAEWGCDDY